MRRRGAAAARHGVPRPHVGHTPPAPPAARARTSGTSPRHLCGHEVDVTPFSLTQAGTPPSKSASSFPSMSRFLHLPCPLSPPPGFLHVASPAPGSLSRLRLIPSRFFFFFFFSSLLYPVGGVLGRGEIKNRSCPRPVVRLSRARLVTLCLGSWCVVNQDYRELEFLVGVSGSLRGESGLSGRRGDRRRTEFLVCCRIKLWF